MNLKPVESSNISHAGYDPVSGTMRVIFKGGNAYDYSGVSEETFNGMIKSKSVGKFFHLNIRAKHNFKKVE